MERIDGGQLFQMSASRTRQILCDVGWCRSLFSNYFEQQSVSLGPISSSGLKPRSLTLVMSTGGRRGHWPVVADVIYVDRTSSASASAAALRRAAVSRRHDAARRHSHGRRHFAAATSAALRRQVFGIPRVHQADVVRRHSAAAAAAAADWRSTTVRQPTTPTASCTHHSRTCAIASHTHCA